MKQHWKRYWILGLAALVLAAGALGFRLWGNWRAAQPDSPDATAESGPEIPEAPNFPPPDPTAGTARSASVPPVRGYTPDPANFATDPASGAEYVKNIIVVYFDPQATQQQREAARKAVGGTIVGTADAMGKWELEVEGDSLEALQQLGEQLEAMPGVAAASPDHVIRAVPQIWPDDPFNSTGAPSEPNRWWALADRLPEAWEYAQEFTGTAQLGLIDTAVDITHTELSGIVERLNAVSPSSGYTHGTGVSGIMAARANNGAGIAGVTWNARVRSIDYVTAGSTTSQIGNSLASCVQNGANAVNISLGIIGASGYPNGLTNKTDRDAEARAAATAISQLLKNGYGSFVVVQSAGNQNLPAEQNGIFCSISLSPNNTGLDAAQAQQVVNRVLIAGASKRGGGKTSYSAYGSNVSLYAPGGDTGEGDSGKMFLPSGGGGYQYTMGTSFSAPQITATAGWMFAVNPALDGGQVGQLLKMGEISPVSNGIPMLDCRRALDQAVAAPYLKATGGGLRAADDYVIGLNTKTKASDAELLLKNNLKAFGGELNYPKAGAAPNQYAATGDEITIARPLGNDVKYTLVIKGDLNGDGLTDARDAQALLRWQAGQWQPPYSEAAWRAAADFNGDGALNQADADAIFAEGMK
ncbi:MAG: S8 family serine peptidase [Oscillospiraceae bacterium]|jgi:hypothetical protein|nr:S8 family serine peptidase [Oscillospiraceae bacterium]